jgi:hypothetical protein
MANVPLAESGEPVVVSVILVQSGVQDTEERINTPWGQTIYFLPRTA